MADRRRSTSRVPSGRGDGSKRPSTRVPRGGKAATSRAGLRSLPKKNQTPLILGLCGGGAFLLILVIVVATSGSTPEKRSKAKGKAPVDVSQLERDGLAKCEEGRRLILRAYDANDKSGLERGMGLITAGNTLLEEANRRSGNMYDTKAFNQAFQLARKKVLELK